MDTDPSFGDAGAAAAMFPDMQAANNFDPQQQQQQGNANFRGMQQQQQQQPPQEHTAMPLADEGFSPRDQAAMWQQNHYMQGDPCQAESGQVESGFISGNTSQPPSMSGHDEDMGMGQGSTATSLYNLDTNNHSEVSSIASSFQVANPQEHIQKIFVCLTDTDQVVADEALKQADKFAAKMKGFLSALATSDDAIIGAIVRVMNHCAQVLCDKDYQALQSEDREPEITRAINNAVAATNILRNLSGNEDRFAAEQGRNLIVEASAVEALTKFLRCPKEVPRCHRILFNSVTTLHTLLKEVSTDPLKEPLKTTIRSTEGVLTMIHLLENEGPQGNFKLMTILIDCLRLLAHGHEDTKRVLCNAGAPGLVVKIIRSIDYKNLHKCAVKFMKVLSTNVESKKMMIANEGLRVLTDLLDMYSCSNPDPLDSKHKKFSNFILEDAIFTLRNISDMAATLTGVDPMLRTLLHLLSNREQHYHHVRIIPAAADTLYNFIVKNQTNRAVVCNMGGVQVLTRVIVDFNSEAKLLGPTLDCLRNLIQYIPEAGGTFISFQIAPGAPMPLYFLQTLFQKQVEQRNWACVKAIVELVRNLSRYQQQLRETNWVELIAKYTPKFINGNKPPKSDCQRVIDSCIACICTFSRDPMNRPVLRDQTLVQAIAFSVMACLEAKKRSEEPGGRDVLVKSGTVFFQEITSDSHGAKLVLQQCAGIEGLMEGVKRSSQNKPALADPANNVLNNLKALREGRLPSTPPLQSPMQQQQQQQFQQLPPQPAPQGVPPMQYQQGPNMGYGPAPGHHNNQPRQPMPAMPSHGQPMPQQQGYDPGFNNMQMGGYPSQQFPPQQGGPVCGGMGGSDALDVFDDLMAMEGVDMDPGQQQFFSGPNSSAM